VAELPEDDQYGFQDDMSPPHEAPSSRPRQSRPRKSKDRTSREQFLADAAKATRMSLRDKLTLIGLLVPLIGFAAFMAVRQIVQEKAEKEALQAAINEFLFTPVEARPGDPRPRAGRVVLIDVQKRALDRLHVALREDLRAKTPAEAETIARMDYTRKVVGRFEMGAEAVELSGTMTLVDRASRTVIASRFFSWGKPPTSIPRAGYKDDVTGPPPLMEMAAFFTEYR
jgi:hypothetical protein